MLKRLVFRVGCLFLLSTFLFCSFTAYALADASTHDLLMTPFYDPGGTNSCSGGAGISGPGLTEINGFKLPAYQGTTGHEDPIVDDSGHIAKGASYDPKTGDTIGNPAPSSETVNPGSTSLQHVPQNMRKTYEKYYINMRWEYVNWNWSGDPKGTQVVDQKQLDWFYSKPPLLLVTNPKTGKSIIAAALESGPAPWVGVDSSSNSSPKQGWTDPQIGTPSTYTGLVSGLPPNSFVALGMNESDFGYASGNKTQLIYSWAPDQNATPGPVNLTQSASTSVTGCSGSNLSNNIVQTALQLAWPAPHGSPMDATPAYQTAVSKIFPGAPYNGADCGAFVGIVMRLSGLDPNYPQSGTSNQQSYVASHPDKYQVIQSGPSTDIKSLQPGDILIVNAGGGQGAAGHTMIYVGPQTGGYNEASASMGSRMPSLGTISSLNDVLGRGYYLIARLK